MAGIGRESGRRSEKCSKELRRAEIVKYVSRGWTLMMIQDKTGIPYEVVRRDWADALKEIKKERNELIEERVEELRLQYMELKQEAWAAWEKSKEDSRKEEKVQALSLSPEQRRHQAAEKRQDLKEAQNKDAQAKYNPLRPKMRTVKIVKIREGRLPATEYLRIILMCLEAEREMEAIDPPRKVKVTGTVNTINWDILSQGIPEGSVPDEIEAELQRACASDITDKVTVRDPSPNGDRELGHNGSNGQSHDS